MQYTLRNVPEQLDREIREEARETGKSINQVVLGRLLQAFGLTSKPPRHRDLGEFAGSWIEDPVVDDALDAQRAIDHDLWQ